VIALHALARSRRIATEQFCHATVEHREAVTKRPGAVREIWNGFVTWLSERDWGGAVDRTGRPSDTEAAYIRSYIWLRLVVGGIGVALPAVLLVGEWWFLDGSLHSRDSLCSYYHSPMGDWFVASLAVIGVLLIAYMLGTWNREFWVSTIAGLALLGVAFFPTERPNLHPKQPQPPCEVPKTKPADCTDLERRLHEYRTAKIHKACAGVALSLLAVISFLFAGRARWGTGRERDQYHRRLAWFHFGCGLTIVAALLVVVSVAAVGEWRLWVLTPLYIGEVVTVLAFGASWIRQGWDLRRWLKRKLKEPITHDPPAEPA
jgi:hypothetical protein